MKNNPDMFSHTFTLPYSALTIGGRLKMDWLVTVFQDAASTQCHAQGISWFDMAKKNLKWVVAQHRIKIYKPIDWMTPLVVQTWRAPWKNLYEVRQFRLMAEQEPGKIEHSRPLVTASSIWILINAANNKPVRLAPNMPPPLMKNPGREPAERLKPNPDLARVDHECSFPVHFLDLDPNEHVNNRVYIRWAVASLPGTLNFEYTPVTCDVIYQKEALPEDIVQSRISMNFKHDLLSTDHIIVRQSSGEHLAYLKLTWKKTGANSLFP